MSVRDHDPIELQKTAQMILFLCANFSKGEYALEIILQSAWHLEINVLLQEPWTEYKDGNWLIK